MRVLLDTHVWIWWLLGSERLSLAERRALDRSAGSGGCHLSVMSLWEAQMLHAKGRLVLDRPFPNWLREAAAPGVVSFLPLGFHGDSVDRLIVATARTHGLAVTVNAGGKD